jgi:HEAT repeat protein
LNEDQILHVLELLRDDSKEDENYALKILDEANLELRLAAAIFLNRNGALKRLICNVDMGDMKLLERNNKLLEKAVEVNITDFLSCIIKNNNPATLLITAKILCNKGNRDYIAILSKKVFKLSIKDKSVSGLYKKTLEAISKRGNEKAFIELLNELKIRKYQKDFIDQILDSIPERSDYIFINILIALLKDIKFEQRKFLKKSLLKMPSHLVLPELFKIIKQEEEIFSNEIRLDAIKILGELEKPYCLQSILENLHLLNINEAVEFAKVLGKYPRNILIDKIKILLNKNDVKIRTSVILILPVIGEPVFLNMVINSLKDADPEVRIACIWAIVNFKDQKAIIEILNLLRDPIERVRREVSKAVGENGNKVLILKLKSLLNDEEETREVRQAIISGLGVSKAIESIDILIDRLELEKDLEKEIINSLSQKKDKEELSRMIDNFKNSSPQLKVKISKAFKFMGEIGEERLIVLLKEKDEILKPYIINILESIGYIEKLTRKLSHKDYYVRKDAAELLSFIGTKTAYRGIVRAANDPVEEVRVKVVKAIEKLETKSGKEILNHLENDPQKRVRKYTQWAIERLKAKEI